MKRLGEATPGVNDASTTAVNTQADIVHCRDKNITANKASALQARLPKQEVVASGQEQEEIPAPPYPPTGEVTPPYPPSGEVDGKPTLLLEPVPKSGPPPPDQPGMLALQPGMLAPQPGIPPLQLGIPPVQLGIPPVQEPVQLGTLAQTGAPPDQLGEPLNQLGTPPVTTAPPVEALPLVEPTPPAEPGKP